MVADVTSSSAVGLRSTRGPILLAIMVTTGLTAIDATILATTVPWHGSIPLKTWVLTQPAGL